MDRYDATLQFFQSHLNKIRSGKLTDNEITFICAKHKLDKLHIYLMKQATDVEELVTVCRKLNVQLDFLSLTTATLLQRFTNVDEVSDFSPTQTNGKRVEVRFGCAAVA